MTDGTPVTKNLEENEVWFRSRCEGCSDIKLQPMRLGKDGSVSALAIYVENTVPNLILEESVLGRMFIDMAGKDPERSVSGSGSKQPGAFGSTATADPGRRDECNAGRESASSGRGI